MEYWKNEIQINKIILYIMKMRKCEIKGGEIKLNIMRKICIIEFL